MKSPNFSHQSRKESLQSLKNQSKVYDLCIVGGGITGAGVARDAAMRGLSVLLIEKDDFAQGTSSRSSKLVHGGVRYLEQMEIGLVFESVQERALLWRNCPDLCHPIAFLFPAFKDSRIPLWQLRIGLWLYDLLATFKIPGPHRVYKRKKLAQKEPNLKQEGLNGCVFYWDGATDDARLTLANIIDAHNNSATILSQCELTGIDWRSGAKLSKDIGHHLHLKDNLSGESFGAYARSVICAAGPWSDQVLEKLGHKRKHKLLSTTRGSHIVVPATKLKINHAIVITHPDDGRVLFAIPWSDFTIIGTTDIFDENPPESVHINKQEVEYLIDAANDYFPKATLSKDDVVSVWSGLRPLIAPDEDKGASQVSREHHIEWSDPGLITVAGGKLTTYRKMSQEVVDKLLEHSCSWPTSLGRNIKACQTVDHPLPKLGGFQAPKDVQRFGQSEGADFDLEGLIEICQQQMPLHLEDIMVRRTHLYYKEPNNGWDLLPSMKKTLCHYLAWDEKRWQEEVAAYARYLQTSTYEALEKKAPSPLKETTPQAEQSN